MAGSPSPDFELMFQDEALRLVGSRNVQVAVWRASPQMHHIDELKKGFHRRRAIGPRTGLMNVVTSIHRVSFSDGVRKSVADLTKEAEGQLGTAHVIEAGGLVGVTTRTFLSTVQLLTRSKTPEKTFDSIDSALGWWLDCLNADPQCPHWSEDEARSLCAWARRFPDEAASG